MDCREVVRTAHCQKDVVLIPGFEHDRFLVSVVQQDRELDLSLSILFFPEHVFDFLRFDLVMGMPFGCVFFNAKRGLIHTTHNQPGSVHLIDGIESYGYPSCCPGFQGAIQFVAVDPVFEYEPGSCSSRTGWLEKHSQFQN